MEDFNATTKEAFTLHLPELLHVLCDSKVTTTQDGYTVETDRSTIIKKNGDWWQGGKKQGDFVDFIALRLASSRQSAELFIKAVTRTTPPHHPPKKKSPHAQTWEQSKIKHTHTNSAKHQRQRFLAALSASKQGVSTLEAKECLDILAPAARIYELRKMGFEILTMWNHEPTIEGRLHRVARYVLISHKGSVL